MVRALVASLAAAGDGRVMGVDAATARSPSGRPRLALVLAPGLVGLIRWLKARLAESARRAVSGSRTSSCGKLFQKEVVVSPQRLVALPGRAVRRLRQHGAMAALAGCWPGPSAFDAAGRPAGVVYLLLLGTFFLALAGLDPGSAFGGMGASREVTVAALGPSRQVAGVGWSSASGGGGGGGGAHGRMELASAVAAPLSTGLFVVPSQTTNHRSLRWPRGVKGWPGATVGVALPTTPAQI